MATSAQGFVTMVGFALLGLGALLIALFIENGRLFRSPPQPH